MLDYYAPAFEVKIEGLTMEADVTQDIIDLTYESSLDTADMFTLRLNNADLRLTDSALFDVGKRVEIYMGYVGNVQPMMLGEIAVVNPEFPEGGAPTLTITGYDRSYRMRHNRKLRTFQNTNASLVAAQIAAENLLIPLIDPASMIFESKTQNSSDMDFLQELAEFTFFEVYVQWDKLYFRLPRPQTELIALEWGKNLSSFSPRLSTAGQVGAVSVLDYDSDLCQPIVGLVPVLAADFDLEAMGERLGSTFLDWLTTLGTRMVACHSIGSFPDALTFAKSIVSAILEGLFEGHGSCIGIPELRAGKMVEINGVGRRFSGKYRISKATHTIGDGGYRTTFEVTQRNSGTILQLMRRWMKGESLPSARQSEQIPGAIIGKVISNVDPLKKNRVLLSYPCMGFAVENWAHVDPPDSGMYFMPNVGDDVLVTFEKGDIDRPRVIGRSWNILQRPPEMQDGANLKRVIQSRTGHTITLDDTPGSSGIYLSTLSGAEIYVGSLGEVEMMSSGGAKIVLDQQGNVIIKSGPTGQIRLNCPQDV